MCLFFRAPSFALCFVVTEKLAGFVDYMQPLSDPKFKVRPLLSFFPSASYGSRCLCVYVRVCARCLDLAPCTNAPANLSVLPTYWSSWNRPRLPKPSLPTSSTTCPIWSPCSATALCHTCSRSPMSCNASSRHRKHRYV